jgi:eukaryotic-like serine/threonine-protein kinase
VAQYGSRPAAGVFEGQILDGKYRVGRALGLGGMGVVVAAHDLGLDHMVAIKLLLPEMLDNAEAVSRFAREARNAVKIKGEHMTRVFAVGTLATGVPYMVMEYLEGRDLHSWVKQQGPLAWNDAVDVVLQACEVVAEAHALPQRIIHRDLKPANLFCIPQADGRLFIKVLDFGISKVTRSVGAHSDMSLTSTGGLMGTPFYMSPEQLDASPVDHRTDIWALGIILHELITGKVPFSGHSVPEVSIKVHSRPAPPLRAFVPDAPEGLQAVILRCLEKDRQRRYDHVGELALALLPFAPRRSKASVERITDIIRTAGLSPPALSLPPRSEPVGPSQPARASAGSITPMNGTLRRGIHKRSFVRVVAFVGAVALASAMVFTRLLKPGSATKIDPATLSLQVPAVLPQPLVPPPESPPNAPAITPSPSASGVDLPPPPPGNHLSTISPRRPTPTALVSPKPVAAVAAPTATSSTAPVPLANDAATGLPTRLQPPTTAVPAPPGPKPTSSHADGPAPAIPDCNPPYVIVDNVRQYKTECLHPEKQR